MSGTETSPPADVGRSRRGWTLFRLRGVPVRLDASWFLIAALLTYVVYDFTSSAMPARGELYVLAVSIVVAVLFFASLLAHEFGHALTSLDRNIPVSSIRLFLLGGVTESTGEPRSAKDEFVIVGVGPLISGVLAAVFAMLQSAVQPTQPFAVIFGYLAFMNLLLAVFNVLPGYPLDGGRLLRAVIWAVVKDPHTATRWAARVGQVFAALLAAFGVWRMFGTAGAFGGVGPLVVGVFLFRGAAEAHARARLHQELALLRAGDLMGTAPAMLDPDLPLHEAIIEIEHRPSLVWPVGDPVLGSVSLTDIEQVPRRDWARTTVADVAHPASVTSVEVSTPMSQAMDALVGAPGHQLIVVDNGRAVGLLTPSLMSAPTRRGA